MKFSGKGRKKESEKERCSLKVNLGTLYPLQGCRLTRLVQIINLKKENQ